MTSQWQTETLLLKTFCHLQYVSLNVPPRMNESGQLTDDERTVTRRIASV